MFDARVKKGFHPHALSLKWMKVLDPTQHHFIKEGQVMLLCTKLI